MNLLRLLLVLLLAAISSASYAEKAEGVRGTAFGVDHAFSMKAPSGWIIDTDSAAAAGVGLVFYPVGKSWKSSEVVLYVRGRPKDIDVQTIDQQVDYTLNDFHSHGSPQYRVESFTERAVTSGRTAKVVSYAGDQWGHFEVVGYVAERKTINFLVMNARSKATFEASLPVFYEILDSYQFIRD